MRATFLTFHIPLPEPVLAAVGRVVVAFNVLEFTMSRAIGSLLTDHVKVGNIVTAELSFRAKRALLVGLFIERHGEPDPDLVTLRALLKRADALEGGRNRVVHSMWGGVTPEEITRIKQTAKEAKGAQVQYVATGIDELHKLADDICQLNADLWSFWSGVVRAHKAMRNPTESFWTDGKAPWSRSE